MTEQRFEGKQESANTEAFWALSVDIIRQAFVYVTSGDEDLADEAMLQFAMLHVDPTEHDELRHLQVDDLDAFNLMVARMSYERPDAFKLVLDGAAVASELVKGTQTNQ